MDHYESFDAEVAGVRLLEGLMAELDPARQMALQQFMAPRATGTLPPMPRTDALVLLRSLDLQPHRQEILDLLVHESSALNVVPDSRRRGGFPSSTIPCCSSWTDWETKGFSNESST